MRLKERLLPCCGRKFQQARLLTIFYAREEQIAVLAVLPPGIFAIECKSYTGQICGDPNSQWTAMKGVKESVLPLSRNWFRAIGDSLFCGQEKYLLQQPLPSSLLIFRRSAWMACKSDEQRKRDLRPQYEPRRCSSLPLYIS
jgi:hypothetical protein